MKLIIIVFSVCILFLSSSLFAGSEQCPEYLNVSVKKLHSNQEVNLCELRKKDQSIVVVNTASHCGFTKQFAGLEALNQKYKDEPLLILGFPSHDFNQEANNEKETASVCYKNYGVTFPMFTPVKVKGDNAMKLFKYLASQSRAPGWNFNKYLIAKGGQVTHFKSKITPLDSPLEEAIKLSF